MNDQNTHTTSVYNILILGPTQSGKSTFIENLRKYVDPDYVPDRMGTGNCSHTTQVTSRPLTTTLPLYGLFNENNNLIHLPSTRDQAIYYEHIVNDRNRSTRPINVDGSRQYQFQIFDTPGLNDTQGNDVLNIAKIFSTLHNSGVTHFNLVIITDSHYVPLYASQQQAFKTYFKLFDDLKSRITILHTHVDDMKRLPGMDKDFDEKLDGRSDFFKKITGKQVPTMRIDCDPTKTAAIQVALRMNVIQNVLKMAIVQEPLVLSKTSVSKLQSMNAAGKIVCEKYQAKLDSASKASMALDKLQSLAITVAVMLEEVKDLEKNISQHDTDDEIQLDQVRYEGHVGMFGGTGSTIDTKVFFIPQDMTGFLGKLGDRADNAFGLMEERTLAFPKQAYTLSAVHKNTELVTIIEEEGGAGKNYWKARFKRQYSRDAHFHVTFCTTKRIRHQKDIMTWRAKVNTQKDKIAEYQRELGILQHASGAGDERDPGYAADVRKAELIDQMSKYQKILNYIKSKTLPLQDFLELANSNSIRGANPVDDADAFEKFLRRKFNLV
ncbi:hypothetical protein EC973_004488 [Apophysomyces ossiformis]|uniref:G domain-containing protein n=1 Tax=Apophysomyces ossiformis TaxID=679940 RepID=A0A8H7BL89_9FUNG|nr:hypothetical protein EC973_004488 [Apophysomyces ossiformis]